MSPGQIAGGDAAVHADVRHRPVHPLLEVLVLRAGIVFPPVAVALPLLPFLRKVAPRGGLRDGSGDRWLNLVDRTWFLLTGSAQRLVGAVARVVRWVASASG